MRVADDSLRPALPLRGQDGDVKGKVSRLALVRDGYLQRDAASLILEALVSLDRYFQFSFKFFCARMCKIVRISEGLLTKGDSLTSRKAAPLQVAGARIELATS